MARIGLLGGSFNPAHRAHRRISLNAIRELGLDEVWWLVSPGNPLKEGARDMAPFHARLQSARRAARRSRIRVSAFEAEARTRYTVDTVRRLKQQFPNHDYVWLMGNDTLPNFHKWRDWRGLARLVPIAVISRPGYDSAAHAARAGGGGGGGVGPRSPPQTKDGRSGVHRRLSSFACRPIPPPQPPFARWTQTGIAECAHLATVHRQPACL